MSELEMLRKQLAETQKQLVAEQDMLEYERNKYERLLARQGKGLAKELMSRIYLDLEALRDIAQNITEPDKTRVLRRIRRIAEYCEEFGEDTIRMFEAKEE